MEIIYFEGTDIIEEIRYTKNGILHTDDDTPAYQLFNENGKIMAKAWYKNGKSHRDDDKPAFICYNENIISKAWYKDGKYYRDNDEANYIYYINDKEIWIKQWCENEYKLKIRENLPSVEVYSENEIIISKRFIYKNNCAHMEKYNNGIIQEKIWFKDFKRHSSAYCNNIKLFRENNLPSKEIYNENGELIESLFIDEYTKVFNSYIGNEICGICHETDNNMITTKCNHIFCKKCIDSWIDIDKDECPYCRQLF